MSTTITPKGVTLTNPATLNLGVSHILELIPVITDVDIAFPGGPLITKSFDTLLPIARKLRAFDTWGEDFAQALFSRLAFGLKGKAGEPDILERMPTHKPEVTEEDAIRVLRWLRATTLSYYPKHEDKMEVTGMLWQTFFNDPATNPTFDLVAAVVTVLGEEGGE